jgi:hypothetical protein
MSRIWNVSIYNGSSWASDGTIPAVGINEITDTVESTVSLIDLADGSQARLIPERKYKTGAITLTIPRSLATDAVINKFRVYAVNNTGLKLTTHSGFTYKGYIESFDNRWLLENKETQRYIPSINFRLFDIDGTGVIISGTTFAL